MNKVFLSRVSQKVWYYIYRLLGTYNSKKLVELRYKRRFKKPLDWDNPQTLNEKILWLKEFSDTSEWTRLADKYLVRQFVETKGLGNYLVKLYGKWDNAEEIDWKSLPDKFVLKLNNGSGDVLICKNKSQLNIRRVVKKFHSLLTRKFGITTGEPHYQRIRPCIIAEELLDSSKQSIKSSSLIDYKIWCFDGIPESIWVCHNRTKESVEVGTYDTKWNYHPEYANSDGHYIASKQLIPKPASLSLMLQMASVLSKGFPVVRVDLYEVDNKPYFGELTFSSNFGMMEFYSDEYQLYLGSKVRLPNE